MATVGLGIRGAHCPQPLSCLLPDPGTVGRCMVTVTKNCLELRGGKGGGKLPLLCKSKTHAV